MKIYKNKNNWVIEDNLNFDLVNKINCEINKNLNSFLNLKDGYSTTGKNVSQYWIRNDEKKFNYRNKNLKEIKKEYKNEILFRIKNTDILNKNHVDITPTNCWTVIGEENSFHTIHNHNNFNRYGITTVLYLNIPDKNEENDHKDNLFLILDTDLHHPLYNNSANILEIKPHVGKLLIFPTWIYHGTYPQNAGIRQTFNLDFSFNKNKCTPCNFQYV